MRTGPILITLSTLLLVVACSSVTKTENSSLYCVGFCVETDTSHETKKEKDE